MKNSPTRRIYLSNPKHFSDKLSIYCIDKIHYMRNVIRLRLNDKIRIFNEIMGEYLAKVTLCDKKEIQLELLDDENHTKPYFCKKLSIAPCMIKNFSNLVDMSVQLGVTEIFPVISNYTSHRKFVKDRMDRIVLEAVEQSERFDIPLIHEPKKLEELDYSSYDAVIYANEKMLESEGFINNTLSQDNILLITGPEGGFAEKEIEFLSSLQNSRSITLGNPILRAETAMNSLISWVNFVRMH